MVHLMCLTIVVRQLKSMRTPALCLTEFEDFLSRISPCHLKIQSRVSCNSHYVDRSFYRNRPEY